METAPALAAAILHTCGAAATIHCTVQDSIAGTSDISQPEYSSDFKSIDKEPQRVSVVEQVDRNIDKRDSVSSLGSDQ